MGTDDEICLAGTDAMLRDDRRLLDDLASIDSCGWEDPVGTALLTFIREDLVSPMVAAEGLRGLAAKQAEATGWKAAWELLCDPALREAVSPWGVVWTVVRRNVREEAMAARYCTGLHRAWRVRVSGGTEPAPTVLSLDRFAEMGIEPTPAQVPGPSDALGDALEVIVQAMSDAGWDAGCASHLVRVLAQTPMHYADRAKVMVGWRPIAADLGLPPWRVRRTMVLLLGEPGWDGLLARVRSEGPGIFADVAVVAALRSTVVEWMRPPRRVAALALERESKRLCRRAS